MEEFHFPAIFVVFSSLDRLLVSPVLALVLRVLVPSVKLCLGDGYLPLAHALHVVLRWVPGGGVGHWPRAMGTTGLGWSWLGEGGDGPSH